MSIATCIGAESAVGEILTVIRIAEEEGRSPQEILQAVKNKALSIQAAAKSGWY